MFKYIMRVIAYFTVAPAAPLALAAPLAPLAQADVDDDFDLPVARMLPPADRMLAAARLRRRLAELKALRGRKIRPKRKPKARARQTETPAPHETESDETDETEVGNVAFYQGLSDTDEDKVIEGNVAVAAARHEDTAMDTDETEVGNIALYQGLSDTEEDEVIEGNVVAAAARHEDIAMETDETEVGNVAFCQGLSDTDPDTDEDEVIEGNVAPAAARWDAIFAPDGIAVVVPAVLAVPAVPAAIEPAEPIEPAVQPVTVAEWTDIIDILVQRRSHSPLAIEIWKCLLGFCKEMETAGETYTSAHGDQNLIPLMDRVIQQMFGTIPASGFGKHQDRRFAPGSYLRLADVKRTTLAFAHAVLIWAPRRNDTVCNREQVMLTYLAFFTAYTGTQHAPRLAPISVPATRYRPIQGVELPAIGRDEDGDAAW